MRWLKRPFLETGTDYSLSPEHWLANETASQLGAGRPLSDFVRSVSQTTTPPAGARFVLDTNNAREGLLDVGILGNPVSGRTSAKKIVRDGDVIISRLRPYLRQVAWVPDGTAELLGVEQFYCSTEFFVLRSLSGINIAGIVGWLLSDPIQEMVTAAATGGHHPRISVDLLLNSPVDERFLDGSYISRLDGIFSSHIKGQRELTVLLGH